ncbi:dehydrogenase [Streptomyces sp. ZL-24]|uniref:NAD(P)/FAD-dependent oxidoreductase n=1 Tax=Streptomyces sp. ZL-24 TaxID=1933029 RepID=UPI000CD41CC1|nr:FAD-dependent oxidoreductase [Streptomyces sp. ZL-24]POG49474.1 dehydrogenase [Streptomyces sp. ZL-24]
MPEIVVVGGGFAGVWAAAAAARLLKGARQGVPGTVGETGGTAGPEHTVRLVTPEDDMVIRPRLYEADPHTMRVPLDRILAPAGVRRTAAAVTAIDTARRTLTAVDRTGEAREIAYDGLVLATGSRLVRPEIPGAEHLHDVDTLAGATALDAHLHTLPDLPEDRPKNLLNGLPNGLPKDRPEGTPTAAPARWTAVVVGSGATGLEVATELVSRLRTIAAPHGAADRVRVVLVERADAVGASLGAPAAPVIARALANLGIETRAGVTVTAVEAGAVTLSDGSRLPARTAVWTAGVRATEPAELVPGRHDEAGRLEVDAFLRVPGVPGVWAAGDAATAPTGHGHRTVFSCQYAIPLGKLAGHNAAATLLGVEPEPFAPGPYVSCLDLGDAGGLYTTGWERAVQLTGDEAKKYKRAVTEQWIYPPLDDGPELLRQADHRLRTRRSNPV